MVGFLITNDSSSVTADDEVKSKYFPFVPLKSTLPSPSRLPPANTNCDPATARHTRPNLEELGFQANLVSSDSSLGDASTDCSSDDDVGIPTTHLPAKSPYFVSQPTNSPPQTPAKRSGLLHPEATKPLRPKIPKVSPYFPQAHVGPESCLPFPPLDAPAFGLVQEQLAHEPFKLLIATIFLNRTRGGVALPILFKVFERYPTIHAMANADQKELVDMIHCLGFQNQRANKCIKIAQTWQTNPPCKDKRYRKMHYPRKLDGRDIGRGECIDDEDHRSGWEVAHLPGIGAYSLDSWRIFCRDELRGTATDWKGTGATEPAFVPEWKSVLPMDKELRAYLTWMWLKEGWEWDHRTGDLKPATEKTLRAARAGGVAHEADGNWVLETSPVKVSNGLHWEGQ
ncbi:hypothetical protein N7470_009274 [Penicillium chermesinum]|nr:hypothetical protein N7470_009274 [Penicillium chermesinum]